MIGRRGALLAVAVALITATLLSGCTLGSNERSSPVTSRSGASSALPDPMHAIPACTTDQVSAEVVFGLGSSRHAFHLAIRVRVIGSRICSIQGAPIVSLAAAPGQPVGASAVPVRSRSAPAPTITLSSRLSARAELVIPDLDAAQAARCRAEPVSGFIVQLDPTSSPIWAPFPQPVYGYNPEIWCAVGGTGFTARPFLPTT